LLQNKIIKILHVQTLQIKEITMAEEVKQGVVIKETMINNKTEGKTAIKIVEGAEKIRTSSNKILSLQPLKQR
jgi:hypothetical protein